MAEGVGLTPADASVFLRSLSLASNRTAFDSFLSKSIRPGPTSQDRDRAGSMAEGVGFEPTVGFPTLDFESSALNRTQPSLLFRPADLSGVNRPDFSNPADLSGVQCPRFPGFFKRELKRGPRLSANPFLSKIEIFPGGLSSGSEPRRGRSCRSPRVPRRP